MDEEPQTNFHSARDTIDLSAFPQIQSVSDLSYSTDPLAILLPNGQQIIFSNMAEFDLTDANFIFASPLQNQTPKKKTLSKNVLVTATFVGGMLVLTLLYFQLNVVPKDKESKRTKRARMFIPEMKNVIVT